MSVLKKAIFIGFIFSMQLSWSMNQQLMEDEVHFVDRTKKLFSSQMDHNLYFSHFIDPQGANNGFYVKCPMEHYHALLRPATNKTQAQLVVLGPDLVLDAREFLGMEKFIALALATNRNMFASIVESIDDPNYPNTTNIVRIQRLDTKTIIKEIKLPKAFEIASTTINGPAIAFNKQNTQLIVWGSNYCSTGFSYANAPCGVPAKDYKIFYIPQNNLK